MQSPIPVRNQILNAKRQKHLTWKQLAEKVEKSPIWVASVCMGMNSAPKEIAEKITEVLDLDSSVVGALMECPNKIFPQEVPTDPLLYRFYEMMSVYGQPMKQIIHEEFGDGIMSAIDFSMSIEKVQDPKGDRVQIVLNGKFLPYKVF